MTSVNENISVFRATVEHIALARQAIEQCHERTINSESALRTFLADDACYLLIAVKDGAVVGSLNGYSLRQPHHGQPQFLMYEIDVIESCRRSGVGRTLVDAFTAVARASGANATWVVTNESNEPAMTLYGGCGYERANCDDVLLELKNSVG